MSALVRYEEMRSAVQRCARIDEAAEIKDKAAALQAYARQRDDAELEVWTSEIKLRASFRIGELVRELDRAEAHGGKICLPDSGKPKSDAIADAGLSKSQAYRYQELAGPREANLQNAGKAAAERYFAEARATKTPATEAGLRQAVTTAVHAALGPEEIVAKANAVKRRQKAERQAARTAAAVEAAAAVPAAAERYTLHHASFTDGRLLPAAASVDVIVTDPPYPAEFLDLFGALGEVAGAVLKPGGLAVVMVGQTYLPDIIQRLGKSLTYHWTLAYLTPGGQASQQFPRRVNAFWKRQSQAAGMNRSRGADVSAKLAPTFTADTAARTAHSERVVQRDAERGKKISEDVLAQVAHTAAAR